MNYCKTHPDLVRLCTNCAHDDCPDGGCKQYKALEKKLQGEKRVKKQADEEALKGTPEVLVLISAAIKALDDLLADPNCGSVYSTGKLERFRNELNTARNNTYGHLVDWKYIAKRME